MFNKIVFVFIKSITIVLIFGQSTLAFSEVNELNRFARCITKSGAEFYGGWWCPHCEKQKKLFGKSAKRLPYVECENTDSDKKIKKCRDITGYPTWKFKDGQIARGYQSLHSLAEYTGCTAPRKR